MTKLQTTTLAALAVALAIPIAVQRSTLSQLRAELAVANTAAAGPVETARASSPREPRESEAEEMARLRREAADLRLKLQGLRQKTSASALPPAGPVLLQPGRAVALEDLVYAGDQTPEGALQSLLSSFRDGDPDRSFGLMLDQPQEEDLRALATPEGREQAVAMLKSQVKGLTALELLELNWITERRVRLVVREVWQNEVKTNAMSFGRGAAGWRQIL